MRRYTTFLPHSDEAQLSISCGFIAGLQFVYTTDQLNHQQPKMLYSLLYDLLCDKSVTSPSDGV